MRRNYYALLIVALLGITLTTASVSAQAPQYKVGDRVEVNMVPGPDKSMAVWKKGSITGVFPEPNVRAYVVQLDPLPGRLPQEMTIPMAREANGDIRAFGGAAPQIQTEKLKVDDNGTVMAGRDLLDCEHLKHDGRNGSPPPPELVKKLIRCLFEKPAQPGMDGATTMDITAITVGAPHRWRVYTDMGQGEPNTLVYPVQVKWNMKTFYRTRTIETTDREAPFTCFADATNLWQCGSSTGTRKEGKTQEIAVKQ